MSSSDQIHPPVPPFTREMALLKVRRAEDAWNSRNPEQVSLAYTGDSRWRNRIEFIKGREQIIGFLTRKWAMEHQYPTKRYSRTSLLLFPILCP